jgi:hypothetical protein
MSLLTERSVGSVPGLTHQLELTGNLYRKRRALSLQGDLSLENIVTITFENLDENLLAFDVALAFRDLAFQLKQFTINLGRHRNAPVWLRCQKKSKSVGSNAYQIFTRRATNRRSDVVLLASAARFLPSARMDMSGRYKPVKVKLLARPLSGE